MKPKARITKAELAAIERHAKRGPKSADASNYMEYTRELHQHVLRLVAELREPRQERMV